MSLGTDWFGLPAVGAVQVPSAGRRPEPACRLSLLGKPKAVCVGGRTEHLFEPDWRGREYVQWACRWCGKKEAA